MANSQILYIIRNSNFLNPQYITVNFMFNSKWNDKLKKLDGQHDLSLLSLYWLYQSVKKPKCYQLLVSADCKDSHSQQSAM